MYLLVVTKKAKTSVIISIKKTENIVPFDQIHIF